MTSVSQPMAWWRPRSRKILSLTPSRVFHSGATSRLRRHTYPTQIFDVLVRPGTSGPFEGQGVPILLPRHGVMNEIWLVEEVEIEELESQLLQWRLTLLQRDHESLYAQSVKPRRIQPSEPANLGALPGIRTVLTDASRIGSESDLFSAFPGRLACGADHI